MTTRHHYSGLTDAQVIESRERHGENVLTPPEKETLWDIVRHTCSHSIAKALTALTVIATIIAAALTPTLGAVAWVISAVALISTLLIIMVGVFGGFRDPLFKVLITAFVLAMGIAVYEYLGEGAPFSAFFEPGGIIIALLLATGIAFLLDRSNEKTFRSLNEVNDHTPVKVFRNNNVSQVPRKDIVVGDIVILETGEEVPADCLLLEALNLIVNESTLTGELQATKTVNEADFDHDATYPSNHIMKGTTVSEGYCTAQVLKVGDSTESGKVFHAAQVKEGEPTPLVKKLNTLARLITRSSYFIGGLIVVGRILSFFIFDDHDFEWLHFIEYLLTTVMIAVTLIVVAVPEGLPMSITLSLAFSMRKLMKENTLPRTIHSCETMGETSVICTDKTGTLTQNRMQVADTNLMAASPELIEEMIAVNTTANLDLADPKAIKAVGNPTEGALLLWLREQGCDYLATRERVTIVDRLPFSTENKYMATVVESRVLGRKVLYVKGAPEILLAICDVGNDRRRSIALQLEGYQRKAMRTLALAYRLVDNDDTLFADGRLVTDRPLTFVGVFAISDPVRAEVPGAINDCINAGIAVKIVTGDTPGTAMEIGRQIGLWNDNDSESNIMTGSEFAAADNTSLLARLSDLKILSRAKPADKERLVRLLHSQGHVVAVTGDGTNDAPALNAADVGLSMGDGTAVAKEASDMTIQDNSFATIANAVMWGRSLFKNIKRFILFQLTINVVACLIVLIGAFTGTESPLTVTQMLWVNLIMDTFAAIALASLPPDRSVMRDKPRRISEPIIDRDMTRRIITTGLAFTFILMLLLLFFRHADVTSVRDLIKPYGAYDGLTTYEISLFFTTFVMMQFWNMFNAKAFMTDHSAFYRITECRGFIIIAAAILLGQIAIIQFAGPMFNVTPLHTIDWLTAIFAKDLL